MEIFYTEIQKIVTRYCGEYLPYRVRASWGQLVLAVMVSGSVVLNRLSGVQAHSLGRKAREKSLARHLKRLVKDERFNWTNLYAPLVKGLLKWNPTERVVIILDETAHTDHFRLLMAGVWYEGRVIPLAWESWLGNTKLLEGVSYWQKVELVLARVAELIPSHQKVVVLADRAYGNPAFIDDDMAGTGWSRCKVKAALRRRASR